ncbi:methyltransferase domain-containing protein [Skeletonema marinoi]|uniref:Methyltransferase domain-containing protein n=1 Tax=Skeletonema marinoi TaxID=267567 RepID=A0AAD8Y0C3_9STRA|nr:methyltransferase domain-containing protein [Skeletonema marinoi]
MLPILYDKTTDRAASAAQEHEQKPEPAQPPAAKTLRPRSEFAGLLAQSGLRASLYLERKNSINGNVSKSNMSEGAIAAIDDLTLQLKFWGKSSLDEEAFNLLLDDIGYSRDRDGLFDDLLEDIGYANPFFDVTSRTISVDNMRQMYASEPYRIPEQAVFNNGEALMSFVEALFRTADVTGDNVLDYDEVKQMLRKLLGSEPTQEVIDEAFKALDVDGDGQVNFEEFKSFMLKANVNDVSDLSSDFNEAILSPSHSSDLKFVTELEKYCKAHRGVNHHLLQNLATAAFGKKETADLLLRFLSAYSKFNSNFISNINALLEMLDDLHHIEVLSDNLEEEMGHYDEETLVEGEKMGIKRESIEGIPHRQLFIELVELLETKLARSYSKFIPDYICEKLTHAIEESMKHGKLGLLAILYFGSELIVPQIYSYILDGLRLSMGLTNEEAKFFILHIDMDKDHADSLREIIIANCRTKAERLVLVKCTRLLLEARVSFYDSVLKYGSEMSEPVFDVHATDQRCFSDIASRSNILHMCRDHIKGATVLDVGCGTGHLSRELLNRGATKTVGVDISSDMIEAANTNLMPGAGFDMGVFDITVASFLFNCMSITEMNQCVGDIHSLLKPGGHFIFIVPHPAFISGCGIESKKYFADRDRLSEQQINDELKTNTYCKTLQDYTDAAITSGFEIVQLEEVRTTPTATSLIVKLRKSGEIASRNNANALNMLPKKLSWSKAAMKHPHNAFIVNIPVEVKEELYEAAMSAYEDGVSVDELDAAGYFPVDSFAALKSFSVSVRNSLLHETGLVLLKGLDLDTFSAMDEIADPDQVVACSKLAYYIICSHIGTVDGSVRGKLFDVKNNHINAMDGKNDNVLFSVSDCEASWHTDGASKDKVYDCVGLLCINPSRVGGKSKITNSCNAFDQIKNILPKFIMHELTRPIPRDILENGKGRGNDNIGTQLSRADSIMHLRISYNSYPIYVTQKGRMRFRYMRHWIETAHQKVHWRLPTMLRIAMDVLDDTLTEGCCFHERLERGDILICNNSCVAHGRDAFQDVPGQPSRHLVRAWMQCHGVDLYEASKR